MEPCLLGFLFPGATVSSLLDWEFGSPRRELAGLPSRASLPSGRRAPGRRRVRAEGPWLSQGWGGRHAGYLRLGDPGLPHVGGLRLRAPRCLRVAGCETPQSGRGFGLPQGDGGPDCLRVGASGGLMVWTMGGALGCLRMEDRAAQVSVGRLRQLPRLSTSVKLVV